MNAILEMREKRAQAWDAAKKFLDTHNTNGTMSAEDAATYDRMEEEVLNLGKQIERLERQKNIEDELNKAVSTPITDKPKAAENDAKNGIASNEYSKAFWQVMRTRNALPREVYDALQVGTNSEGGYLVPDEFERTLVMAMEEENIFRTLAHKIKTSSGDRKIPIVTSHGSAAWTDEEAAYTESDEAFGQISLSAYKLGTLIKVSEELLNDSAFDLPSYLSREFARRFATKEEEAFIVGTGSGQPTGLLAAKSGDVDVGAMVGVTATSKTEIKMDEVIDLFYSLKAPYRRKAVWLMNDASVKAIRKMKTGDGVYLWNPSVVAGQPDTLLNRPVYTSAFVPVAAQSAKPMAFGDMSYYWIADRETRVFKRLNELYAANGQVGFIGHERVDGRLILPEAVKCMQMAAS